MTTQELVGTDVEIINALDFEPELACEALVCVDSGLTHAASWMLIYTCGCSPLICNDTKIAVEANGREQVYWCARCGATAMWVVSIIPIERKK